MLNLKILEDVKNEALDEALNYMNEHSLYKDIWEE